MRQWIRIMFVAVLILASRPLKAQSLNVRLDGDRLRINVARVRLLTGDPLQQLRDGASVTYTFQLSALNTRSGMTLTRATYRFVISYDIFEERFQVSRLQPSALVLSYLTMAAAEAAMLEALELPAPAIDAARAFWVRWEFQADDPSQGRNSSGSPLGGLVDIFSRKSSNAPLSGAVESGPFRLRDLSRVTPTRGPANP
jgi:hypothetical protein